MAKGWGMPPPRVFLVFLIIGQSLYSKFIFSCRLILGAYYVHEKFSDSSKLDKGKVLEGGSGGKPH